MSGGTAPTARFVDLHFVDENYHKRHSQLLHRHEDVLELFYVMKGEGQYIVGGREYIVQPGSLVICNANVLHGETPFREHTMESYCCVLQNLCLVGLPENTLSRPAWNPVLYFSEDREAVEHILLALFVLHTHPENRETCSRLANALLALVYSRLRKRQQPNGVTDKNTEEFIQSIMQYLDEHYMEPISLPDLGARFHISHHYLSHIFKDETGLSPMKYVMYRKIGESQNLLMNTDLPVGAISDRLGFSDNCHFSAMFKKYIGITPSQYRQHFQSSDKFGQTTTRGTL